jgi:hypothetical protein
MSDKAGKAMLSMALILALPIVHGRGFLASIHKVEEQPGHDLVAVLVPVLLV